MSSGMEKQAETKTKIFDLLLGKGVQVLRHVLCRSYRGSGRSGKGFGGVMSTRRNSRGLFIASGDANKPPATYPQTGGAEKCAKIDLVSPAEQTSEIAASHIQDEDQKDRYLKRLLQLDSDSKGVKKGAKKTAKKRKSTTTSKKKGGSVVNKRRCKTVFSTDRRQEIPIFK